MPTISLLNGHAFAGALMLAMMHDYRVMNPHRGYLCLNELELGVPLRPPMSSIFRQKVSPSTYRSMVLEARRYKTLDTREIQKEKLETLDIREHRAPHTFNNHAAAFTTSDL
ncbi:hypothetical protein LTR66_011986 [Elasticomyces elasticus]|nr:hypothetical protein LTR66_011986 [Elasticomyces elasticus]